MTWHDPNFGERETYDTNLECEVDRMNLAKCGKCGKEWDDETQCLFCPHPLLPPVSEVGKWMKIANQNALEREQWADRYDKLHIALCQSCECLNQGDSATAHNIIREALA